MDNNTEKLAEHAIDKYKYLILLVGIPLLIAFIRNILIDLLVKDAHKIADQAKLTDDELAKKQAAVKAQAEEIAKRIKEALAPKPVDENWNNEPT